MRHLNLALAAFALASCLVLLLGCSRSGGAKDELGIKQAYSLCPKTADARRKLDEQVRNFAADQNAHLIDRGPGGTDELSDLNSEVLENTGGEVILLTVEKRDVFRVSVTNLGLKEKVGLAVRLLGGRAENPATTMFL